MVKVRCSKINIAIMIAEFTIENFFSIRTAQTFSFEATTDKLMSDEYSYEV